MSGRGTVCSVGQFQDTMLNPERCVWFLFLPGFGGRGVQASLLVVRTANEAAFHVHEAAGATQAVCSNQAPPPA